MSTDFSFGDGGLPRPLPGLVCGRSFGEESSFVISVTLFLGGGALGAGFLGIEAESVGGVDLEGGGGGPFLGGGALATGLSLSIFDISIGDSFLSVGVSLLVVGGGGPLRGGGAFIGVGVVLGESLGDCLLSTALIG